jgi:hypothetical protein
VTRFSSARHFGSWMGLTPREHSSANTRHLHGISKRGDNHLRAAGGRVLWASWLHFYPLPERLHGEVVFATGQHLDLRPRQALELLIALATFTKVSSEMRRRREGISQNHSKEAFLSVFESRSTSCAGLTGALA